MKAGEGPPTPARPRKPIHARRVAFDGWLRDDGLWEIDGVLLDVKHYDFRTREDAVHPAGEPIHQMWVRLLVNEQLTVLQCASGLVYGPYAGCEGAADPAHQLAGASLVQGWRAAIDRALGGVRGCTHLRELLFGAATAAFQTIYPYRALAHADNPSPAEFSDGPPAYLDKCLTWDRSGHLVEQLFPMHYRPKVER